MGICFGKPIILYALHKYDSTSREDTSFEKGDKLRLIRKSDDEWWLVKNMRTGLSGLIPVSFVVPLGDYNCKDYFHGRISRKEADSLLLNNDCHHGIYMIRNSENNKPGYSLSVKIMEKDGTAIIKHYKIQENDNQKFWLRTNVEFNSLDELVEHYKAAPHGLCCRLMVPCPKPRPDLFDITPMHRTKWEIPRGEIRLESRIGSGNFGEVWRGLWNENVQVAVKTMKGNSMTKEEFLKEAAIMKGLRHRKLISLYGVCSTNNPILMITEYMKNGSLLDYLRSEHVFLKFDDLIYIAAQIASGMSYLEKSNKIHRDLAARNVLVADNNIVKIADFGLARVMQDKEYQITTNAKFPIKWTAPEAISSRKFTTKSDVWSYGILLYELFTKGSEPYPNKSTKFIMDNVHNGYKMPKPRNHVPDAIYEIMCKCWDLNPDRRPTFVYLTGYFEDYGINAEQSYD